MKKGEGKGQVTQDGGNAKTTVGEWLVLRDLGDLQAPDGAWQRKLAINTNLPHPTL